MEVNAIISTSVPWPSWPTTRRSPTSSSGSSTRDEAAEIGLAHEAAITTDPATGDLISPRLPHPSWTLEVLSDADLALVRAADEVLDDVPAGRRPAYSLPIPIVTCGTASPLARRPRPCLDRQGAPASGRDAFRPRERGLA